MKIALISLCIIVVILKVNSQLASCPRTSGRIGICAFTCREGQCRRGRECCRTGCGGTACMRRVGGDTGVPRWCPPGSPRIRCFVNPCTVMTCPSIPWARCINDNPCERACSGNFYVGRFRVSSSMCRRGSRG